MQRRIDSFTHHQQQLRLNFVCNMHRTNSGGERECKRNYDSLHMNLILGERSEVNSRSRRRKAQQLRLKR
jgi:hypothetical protein